MPQRKAVHKSRPRLPRTRPVSKRVVEARRQALRQRYATRTKARLALKRARTPLNAASARLQAMRHSRSNILRIRARATRRREKPRIGRIARIPRAKPRPKRKLAPSRERFRLFKRGIRMVPVGIARGMRVAAPHARQSATSLARWGSETLHRVGGTTLHYGGEIIRIGGEEAIVTGGELAGHTLRNSGEVLRKVGGTAISEAGSIIGTIGEVGIRGSSSVAKAIGTQAIESGSELGGRVGSAVVREGARAAGAIAEAGLGLAATGIEAGAVGTTKLAQGLLLRLPKWAARRTLDFIASKRALRRVVNPNLAGKWKLIFRKEGTPVTMDGFVVHTIQSKPFRVGRRQKRAINVNVEFGFTEDGRFTVRIEPVLDGASREEDELIQRLYQKHFRSVRRGVRSLTTRLGGARGIRDIRERYLSEEAFPREPYTEPETTTVEPEAPVPEDAAVDLRAPEPAPA